MEPRPWEERLDAAWAAFDEVDAATAQASVEALADELGPDSAIGCFERAGAHDTLGRTDLAVPLYRRALSLGLAEDRRRRAVIQLASSLRVLGEAGESAALLEREAVGSDDLDGAVAAFHALALADLGRGREALSVALTALARRLPRYRRSVAAYAAELGDGDAAGVAAGEGPPGPPGESPPDARR